MRLKKVNDSATDRALAAFDAFLAEWIPTVMHDYVFGHITNAADIVRYAIRGIADQTLLPIRADPFGWAVFQEEQIAPTRDHPSGHMHTPVSPVFEFRVQGENSLDGFRRRRSGYHILGEIREP